MPYDQMRNAEVVDFVCSSRKRLAKPDPAPIIVYSIMLECWDDVSVCPFGSFLYFLLGKLQILSYQKMLCVRTDMIPNRAQFLYPATYYVFTLAVCVSVCSTYLHLQFIYIYQWISFKFCICICTKNVSPGIDCQWTNFNNLALSYGT